MFSYVHSLEFRFSYIYHIPNNVNVERKKKKKNLQTKRHVIGISAFRFHLEPKRKRKTPTQSPMNVIKGFWSDTVAKIDRCE